MNRPALIVVGAGPAGLCTAWAARAHGLEPLILERGKVIGGAWARMPSDTRCLSPRLRDRLPDGSCPGGTAERASASRVLEALVAFAARADFDIRLGTGVEWVSHDGSEFTLSTSDGELRTPRLVVATGEYERPWTPELPGDFGGPSHHARHFRVGQAGPGERVAVVGAGNSGAEVAVRLSRLGARVVVSSPRPLRRPPPAPSTGVWAAVLWRLSALPVARLPRRGGCTDATPLVDPDLFDAVAAGEIEIVGAAARLHPDGFETDDGQRVRADRLVWATGYRRDTSLLEGLVPLDSRGAPRHHEGVSTDLPGLGFVGIPCQRTRRSGFLRGFAADADRVVQRLGS